MSEAELSPVVGTKSVWIIRAAWISTGIIVIWAAVSFFVLKPVEVSLLHLVIWGQMMILNLCLFVVGFIVAASQYCRSRSTTDMILKQILFRRVLWSLPGLAIAVFLVCILVFLTVSVFQAIVTVR